MNGELKPFQIGGAGVKINSNLRIRPKHIQEEEKEEAALVAEVLRESPPEAKGERPEWQLKTGVHRKEDLRAPNEIRDDHQLQIWEKIEELFYLGTKNPHELVELLETKDPFGTAHPEAFQCPKSPAARIDSVEGIHYPYYDKEGGAAAAFRRGDKDSFIFYQHLRKAGGTGFCELAKKNMKQGDVPPYYCMPDNRGSLATPPWLDAAYLQERLQSKGHRIASNEWDAWNREQHNPVKMPKAVFTTTFRHPLDRFYSQYRFEHLEHRDGSQANAPRQSFMAWYGGMVDWTVGFNYYLSTFEGQPDQKLARPGTGDFYWTYHKFQRLYKKHEIGNGNDGKFGFLFFKRTLMNLQQFHLILVTEFLDLAPHFNMITKTLAWTVKPKKTLPHAQQAHREIDNGTGMTKSVRAKDALLQEDYMRLASENVFDVLFYAIVRRLVLERMTCSAPAY